MLVVHLLAFLGGAAVVACLWIRTKLTYPTTNVQDSPTQGKPEDAVILYGWQSMPKPPGDTAIGASPFVARMEAWLRFANIPYKYVGVGDTNKAPKGQLPYIKHGSNTVGDTVFITKYLEATYGNPPPNSALMALTPQQQALCTLCTGFALERLMYLMLCYRFLSEPGYARHSADDINKLMHADLKALSVVLGDKPYLLGDAPCDADAAVFAALDQMVCGRTVAPELNKIVRQYPSLCQYTTRIHERFFADKAPSAQHGAKSGKAV